MRACPGLSPFAGACGLALDAEKSQDGDGSPIAPHRRARRTANADAAGPNALAAAARQARTRRASLHVVSGSGQARWLITITGLDQAIPLTRTIDEAAAALSPARAPRASPPPGSGGCASSARSAGGGDCQ
jgi:hypothetical protein